MDEYPVKATATTFRIVETLAETETAGVTELADRLDLSKGAVHNHLATLERLGYVVNDGGRYRLGLGFLDIGGAAREHLPVYRVAVDEVRRLAERSGAVASLVVEEEGRAVYVFRAGSDGSAGPREGSRRPLHASAAGKAILAHRPEDEVRSVVRTHGLDAVTDRTVTDADALFAELQSVRDRGTATDREEDFEGVSSVAAPLLSEDRYAVGAVAVSGPADRMSGKRLEEDVTGLVVTSAKSISVDLYSG